ncbi:hcalcium-binding protein, partial [Photobacterium sp. BZF1]|nr:hcalcium-binding protein [Photobacterium sp. BZF1]
SFGADNGVSIDETDDKGQVISGQIPLNVGSDEIYSVVFQSVQPSLTGLTSNGYATSFTVAGNVLTVLDVNSAPIMTVTVKTDGTYDVKVTGPIDQGDSESTLFNLNVTATDKDGDPANGTMAITVSDGDDASGSYFGTITLTEGDLDTDGDGVNPADTDTSYPATQSGSFELAAGEDRLVPTSIAVDPAQVTALITELKAELTSGGQALDFALNSDGDIVGTLNGEPALTVELSAVQNGQGLTVTVNVTQSIPLDHNNTGDTAGFISSKDDQLQINVQVQAKDTDGDDLTTAAVVGIIIKDGDKPLIGVDSGTVITETKSSQTVSGAIDLDVGSDEIGRFDFASLQSTLVGLTTNGQATTYSVNGNVISVTVFGGANDGDSVLTINMNNDGTYTVRQDAPLEQDNAQGDDIELVLGVTATDKDGDTSNVGQVKITINDGQDPTGENVTATLSVVEGDLENPATGKEYPSTGTGSFTVEAVNDNLVAASMRIDPAIQTALLTELEGLTSDGDALDFSLNIDSGGVITITGVTSVGSTEVLTITMTPASQSNGDVSVAMTIAQSAPLDHTSGSGSYVDIADDGITIDIPVQMDDEDGDDLLQPVIVNVTITDGDIPAFGADSIVNLDDGNTGVSSGTGQVELDTGSDSIVKVYFHDTQSSLNGLTSNGLATVYSVSADGSEVVVTLASDPTVVVFEASIDINGNYTVDQKQPIDQVDDLSNDNEIIVLDVLADDKDGDTSETGHIRVLVNDGSNPLGGQIGSITITEGDLTPEGTEQPYPVTDNVVINVAAGVDRLDPNSVEIDSAVRETLISELQNELKAGGSAISFSYDSDTATITGSVSNVAVLTIAVSAVQSVNSHDVVVTTTVTQYQPLDHSGGNGSNLVTTDGEKITIDVPVQVSDTDGDKLETGIVVDVTINDGDAPNISAVDDLYVEESDINGGGGIHR